MPRNDFLQARKLIMPSTSIGFHRFKQKDKIFGLLLFFQQLIEFCQARGGGSKRTFGSPKTQSNQNLAECNDQINCSADVSDPSWMSVFGATMALVGPLLVLLAFIVMIKFCLVHSYPKGYHNQKGTSKEYDNLEKVETGVWSIA